MAKHGKNDAPVSVTEEELHDIIDEMAEEGTLDENQSELISSALEFGDLTAESILTPRVDICAIDIDSCVENGVLSDMAEDIIVRMDTYTEYSPSV